jgi:Fe-coproporphyrin III synthase
MNRWMHRISETWTRLFEAGRNLLRFAHRMLVLRGELERDDGSSRPPMLVQIKLTNRCNMRCRMCGQWGETGYHHEHDGKQAIDLELAKRFVDEIAGLGIDLTLWGGEPLVYPGLEELLAHCRQRRVPVGIITNGLTLDRHAEMLVRHRVKDLIVSLDGPPRIHDAVRGVDGAFDRTIAGMHEVARQRRELGALRPRFRVSNVVSEDTWPHLEELYDTLQATGLDILHVVSTLRWWTDDATGAAYERCMEDSFGCAAPSWQGFRLDEPPAVDTRALNEIFARVKRKRYRFKVVPHPRLTPEQVAVFFANTSISFGRETCLSPWVYALLLPDGEMTFCPDFPDYRIGSLKSERFETLWNGDLARSFRQRILQGLLPICPRCCGMYTTGTPWRRKAPRG